MQVLRQFVVSRPSWRADVQLHADAAVCLCCENRYRTELPVGSVCKRIGDRSPTRSRPPSDFFFRSALPPVSTKVASSIHRVHPASGFLLVAQSKATRRGGFSCNSGPHSAASLPIGH